MSRSSLKSWGAVRIADFVFHGLSWYFNSKERNYPWQQIYPDVWFRCLNFFARKCSTPCYRPAMWNLFLYWCVLYPVGISMSRHSLRFWGTVQFVDFVFHGSIVMREIIRCSESTFMNNFRYVEFQKLAQDHVICLLCVIHFCWCVLYFEMDFFPSHRSTCLPTATGQLLVCEQLLSLS